MHKASLLFRSLAGLAILVAAPAAMGAGRNEARPNIVYILADDLGLGDVRCLNPSGKIATPNLDRLAAAGLVFTDAHSGSSVCTPTRYGILTGRYAWRSRLQVSVLGGCSPRLIEPGRLTVAELLRRAGYHTAAIGKWHLGMDWPLRRGRPPFTDDIEWGPEGWNIDFTRPIANGPNAVGFDEFFGISGTLDMVPYTFIENDRVAAIPAVNKSFPMMHGRPERETRRGPGAAGFKARDVLPALTRRAAAAIRRRADEAKAGRPFFLYLALTAPHTPIAPARSWLGRSGLNPYADFVMQVDAAVGEVLGALDAQGLTDQTLVIVTSDNGCSPEAMFGELLARGHDPSAGFRGCKADIFEGGHRVPFLVRWPGVVAPGRRSDQLICLTDLMATCAEIIGRRLPDDAGEDSVSLLPALQGRDRSPMREAVVHHSINGSFAIRQGDWKLALCGDSGGWSAPRPGARAAAGLPPIQLYNLAADPGEKANVQDRFPEIVARLTRLLEKYVAEGRSTPGRPQKNDGEIVLSQPEPPAAQQPGRDHQAGRPADLEQLRERTCFQTNARWDRMLQLGSDVAICYGVDPTLPERIAQWKVQGYIPHLMTGVSWGEYQDYLYGRFDGVRHVDEAQTDRNGNVISHGGDVYYMSPGENFGKFLCQGAKRAMDAGALAIHLEEPEFWVRAGYSEGFKREWRSYYHEDWVPPHATPDAQYHASLLKYFLYRRALKQVFDFVKEENRRTGRQVKCYVPSHSLINYAHWGIVSPESSLIEVGADGFIAQVWTGTARTPNVYRGVHRERTFETAFLEYGAMMNVVQAGGGRVWFLNDPVEDDPDHSWEDYRTNWESTLTASLLWPQVWRYEVMPWPERVFHGRYPTVDRSRRRPGEPLAREPIPPAYATELLTVITALNDMEQGNVVWDSGTRGVGVIVSDTLMFQRGDPSPSDPDLGSFYGLAMPMVKHGIPAVPAQLENATIPGALKDHRVLLMTYEGMKPMKPEVHAALAGWVRQGGALVFVDDDRDPYNGVKSWWNDGARGMSYRLPREHLFEQLGLAKDASPGTHKVGAGWLIYDASSPAGLTHRADGADQIRGLVRRACESIGLEYRETNHLALHRGPYLVAAGLDESIDRPPHVLRGRFINLFDARLSIVESVALVPGSRHLLLDLDRARASEPAVLTAAFKVLGAEVTPDGSFRFFAEGPDKIEAVARVVLPSAPAEVRIDDQPLAADAWSWDAASKTVLLRFPNAAGGRWVRIK
jgi:arylsulfatase A-like enzyme